MNTARVFMFIWFRFAHFTLRSPAAVCLASTLLLASHTQYQNLNRTLQEPENCLNFACGVTFDCFYCKVVCLSASSLLLRGSLPNAVVFTYKFTAEQFNFYIHNNLS